MSPATEIGVTGTIQRYHHFDIVVYVEGTNPQLDDFFNFLQTSLAQNMFSNLESHDEKLIQRRVNCDFFIVTDHSKTVDKGGKVEKGPHSDDDHEKKSVSSAGSGVFLGFQPQHT